MATIENFDLPIIDEVYLRDYKKFIKIDNTYYGGNQSWLFRENYISKFKADRSCGVIAASNVFHYMSRDNYNIKTDQEDGNVSKDNFLFYSMGIYKFIRPRIYGIPTVYIMDKGLKKFAKSVNLEMKSYKLINPSNKLETIQFIKKAMVSNRPVMMITWNTKVENLKNHWVTITGYYKNVLGENFVVTSNWASKEVFSLNKWLDNKSFYKALLYFDIFPRDEKGEKASGISYK